MERGRRVRPLNRYAVWNDAVGNALTLYCSNSKRCLALQPPPRIALTTHEGLPPAQPTINGCLPSAPPVPPRDPPRFLKAPIHDKRWLNARTLYPAQAISWFPLSIRGTHVTDPLPQSGNFLGAFLVLWHGDGGNNLFVGGRLYHPIASTCEVSDLGRTRRAKVSHLPSVISRT